MCSALVLVHRLKNELYSCVALLCSNHGFKNEVYSGHSALVSVHGVKKEVYLCVAPLFRFID